MMLRVLTIASELPPVRSGVARSAGRVVEGLRARGHHVDTLCSADAFRRYYGEFRLSALSYRFARLGRLTAGYDIVHLHGPAPFIADAFLARWRLQRPTSTRLVYTHGFTLTLDQIPRISAAYDRVSGVLLRSADAVAVTTPSYESLVRSQGARRAVVIPWGVDAPPVPPAPRAARAPTEPLRVLFVGQQRPYKGIHHLIDAVAGLDALALTIVGGGPSQPAVIDQIQRLGATNIVHQGAVDDTSLAALMGAHDVIALPSTNRSEAFGLVLLEGMAAGCVAVASDLPGVCDVVGDVGLLVPPRDVDALRAALAKLAGDPGLVSHLADAGQRRVQDYTWDRTVTGYEQLFLEVAGR